MRKKITFRYLLKVIIPEVLSNQAIPEPSAGSFYQANYFGVTGHVVRLVNTLDMSIFTYCFSHKVCSLIRYDVCEISKSMKIGIDRSVLGYSYKVQSAAQP